MTLRLEDVRSVLTQTPVTLRSMLADAPDHLVRSGYGPGTWSPFDVLGHLIHGDKTDWIPRARHILERGEDPPFAPFDRSGHLEPCRDKAVHELLDTFQSLRTDNLAALDSLDLSPANLARTGTHPALGPVTLSQLLASWAVHDLHHVAQICKGLAYRFRDEVGPWVAYMGILPRP